MSLNKKIAAHLTGNFIPWLAVRCFEQNHAKIEFAVRFLPTDQMWMQNKLSPVLTSYVCKPTVIKALAEVDIALQDSGEVELTELDPLPFNLGPFKKFVQENSDFRSNAFCAKTISVIVDKICDNQPLIYLRGDIKRFVIPVPGVVLQEGGIQAHLKMERNDSDMLEAMINADCYDHHFFNTCERVFRKWKKILSNLHSGGPDMDQRGIFTMIETLAFAQKNLSCYFNILYQHVDLLTICDAEFSKIPHNQMDPSEIAPQSGRQTALKDQKLPQMAPEVRFPSKFKELLLDLHQ